MKISTTFPLWMTVTPDCFPTEVSFEIRTLNFPNCWVSFPIESTSNLMPAFCTCLSCLHPLHTIQANSKIIQILSITTQSKEECIINWEKLWTLYFIALKSLLHYRYFFYVYSTNIWNCRQMCWLVISIKRYF